MQEMAEGFLGDRAVERKQGGHPGRLTSLYLGVIGQRARPGVSCLRKYARNTQALLPPQSYHMKLLSGELTRKIFSGRNLKITAPLS